MNERAVRLWNAINGSGNLRAFLRVLRAGESSQGDDAYRMVFGGGLVDDLADHPRRAITRPLGGRTLTSTAAGAYQFLARTWDECARALALPDFSQRSQDIAAVYLIERRRALDDVLAGRLDAAVAKCAREWASLPGSPYGQPVKTMEQVREVYRSFGGVERPDGAPAPVESRDVPAAPPPPKETDVSPFVAAALPSLVELLPKLGRIFSSGSKTAERNVAAAEVVAETVIAATGSRNIQEAVEAVRADPVLRQAAEQAIDARWYELTEAGGGGIEGARKANASLIESGVPMWKNPAFLISLVLIVMPMMLVTDVLFVHPENYTGELRVQIVTAVLAVIAMIAGYWIGTSFSSARKDERKG